jgi:prepilin peptidase CpaA
MDRILLICAAGIAIVAAWFDVRSARIPNWFTYGALLGALLLRGMLLGWAGLKNGALGIAIAGGIFFLLFLLGGMGGGDVKLMAAVGAWAGDSQVLLILLGAAIAGGVLALGYMISSRQVWRTISNTAELIRYHATEGLQPHPFLNIRESGTLRVPYGVAIAMGSLYCAAKVCWWR